MKRDKLTAAQQEAVLRLDEAGDAGLAPAQLATLVDGSEIRARKALRRLHELGLAADVRSRLIVSQRGKEAARAIRARTVEATR